MIKRIFCSVSANWLSTDTINRSKLIFAFSAHNKIPPDSFVLAWSTFEQILIFQVWHKLRRCEISITVFSRAIRFKFSYFRLLMHILFWSVDSFQFDEQHKNPYMLRIFARMIVGLLIHRCCDCVCVCVSVRAQTSYKTNFKSKKWTSVAIVASN